MCSKTIWINHLYWKPSSLVAYIFSDVAKPSPRKRLTPGLGAALVDCYTMPETDRHPTGTIANVRGTDIWISR